MRIISDCNRFIGLLAILMCGWTLSSPAQSGHTLKNAYTFFAKGEFHEAANAFASHCQLNPKDEQARIYYALSLFETNKVAEAVIQLKNLAGSSGKAKPEVHFYLAQALQHKHAFSEAIVHYKDYLRKASRQDPMRQRAIQSIERCAIGDRLYPQNDNVLIEHMGTTVNSMYDDFHPVESPNIPSRIYYTSNRPSANDTSTVEGNWDMLTTEIIQGTWANPFSLNDTLNTDANEMLEDFAQGGQVLIFTRSEGASSQTFMVDTFARGLLGQPWHDHPFRSDEKIRGLHLWQDSLLLFASDRQGGHGGFDLYFCRRNEGSWESPRPFGPLINNAFDAISPYLASDGRTLYYSCNDLQSMGGFDVFKTTFDAASLTWSPPLNLAEPINSAGDDIFFRLSADGTNAYFSSSRKSGMGGQDLYAAYFRLPMQDGILESSNATAFTSFLPASKANDESIADSEPVETTTRVTLPVLFYQGDQVLSRQNVAKLQNLSELMRRFPSVTLEIICHSDAWEAVNFELFFSMKRAEQVATFLQELGVESSRLHLKGLGGAYPIAQPLIQNQINETAQFYNRRIDLRLHFPGDLPLSVTYDLPELSPALSSPLLANYYTRVTGLSYRVLFLETDQLYKGGLISKYQDPCLEKAVGSGTLRYSSGLFRSFDQALKHHQQIKAEQFDQAQVMAYLDGLPLAADKINGLILERFPDLKAYIAYKRQR